MTISQIAGWTTAMSNFPVPLNQLAGQQLFLSLPTQHSSSGLPVPNSTRSFWIDSPGANPLANEGSEGPLTSDADICIIGSGITGVSTAYHLSQALRDSKTMNGGFLKAAILEARDFCSGATGRNGGHLTPSAFLKFNRHAEAYGEDEAIRSLAVEHRNVDEIVDILRAENLEAAVDLVAGGHITLFFSEREVEDAKADFVAAKRAGANLEGVQWVDKQDMLSTYGASYPGVRFPGHNLWPLKLVTGLYKLAGTNDSKLSLHLHTHTPVTSVSPLPPTAVPNSLSRRWMLETPRGSIACSYVVHATNGYASHLLPQMHGPTGIIPTRGQVLAVRASASAEKLTKTGWGGNEGLEYWFPRPVNSSGDSENPLVILGGGREVSGPRFETYQVDDATVNEDVGRALRAFLPHVFPGKFEVGREPEMEWTGIMGHTTMGDPFVGPVMDSDGTERRGQYISAGYTGHGMARAFACAEAVAQMIVADLTGQEWAVPDWMPKRYLTWERGRDRFV